MGAGAALAIATRFFMAALLPAILVTTLSAHGWRPSRRWITQTIFAGLAAAVLFFLFSPFVFLDSTTLLADLQHEARPINLGSDGMTPLANFVWYLTSAIPDNLTWLTWILALAGLSLFARKADKRTLPLLTFVAVTLIGISLHPLHSYRWVIQILPILTIAAALALDTIIERFRPLLPQRRLALLTVVFFLSIWPFTGNVVRTISMMNTSTLMQAREWLQLHAVPGETIADATYLDPFQRMSILSILHFSLLDFGPLESLHQQGITYIIIDASREKTMREQPQRYAEELTYFDELKANVRLAASFPPSSFVRGNEFRIYDLRP